MGVFLHCSKMLILAQFGGDVEGSCAPPSGTGEWRDQKNQVTRVAEPEIRA